ncbi:undecaprenyl-diphosphatase 2 [Clostridium pasteurianum DSM 525 = ATCC 6013]|uniref:Undecaprenyl-diphosphatase n=1 Tax=Clostridium pasteurianum DSM 525 = ATCC 6013 TaxID=1262449 RepID=A0A0H3J7U9_CLOPA|nr:undecaprenyl-diphosphate phosphatase [Clostridium pasteurianum]AJA47080.1 undecaprenyl-diphosphatase 2 [Clostridium pasteurianum DSM 525 = ATCC 6013]AJA51068.1 undecaprenyl-diphosphatase 2 [Clostridium pasteurianum DSM 525 = ATCC 6013]AOZ74443.1 UDP-diphosphatase [Clostridium pasteurianum DSM 525 = ATCC 6013]AOZ78240.1 UDP-diphosphatase [Clostridium pasteurianum]ELP59532.1 undecaprenyl pyrophosphate phosphatase [Clostridium pasteurianum DSM 525 = ATCC 6013]
MDSTFILKAIIIAIVEGLTEFIPVSSTGHMILVGWAIDFRGEFAKMFEVVIQLGAIMAVVVLYWKKIKESIVEFFKFIFTRGRKGKTGFRFGINVIAASIPMGITGALFYDKIKSKFIPEAVIVGFIVGGVLLIIIEKVYINKAHKVESIDSITPVQVITIGLLQLLAVWPGMSRSASTIMGGWIAGLSTPIAAEFSFFIAIPAMIGSSGKDLFEFDYSIMTPTLWIALIAGFIVAFLVALIVMKKFVDYLKKKPMKIFAVYRIVVGILLGVLVLIKIITLTE